MLKNLNILTINLHLIYKNMFRIFFIASFIFISVIFSGCSIIKDRNIENSKESTTVTSEEKIVAQTKSVNNLQNYDSKVIPQKKTMSDLEIMQEQRKLVEYKTKHAEYDWQEFENQELGIKFEFPIPVGATVPSTAVHLDDYLYFNWDIDFYGRTSFATAVSKNFMPDRTRWYTENYEIAFEKDGYDHVKNPIKIDLQNGLSGVVYTVNNYLEPEERAGQLLIVVLPDGYYPGIKTINFFFAFEPITFDDIVRVANSLQLLKK
ncbi:MAG: hypothetical protein WA057_02465 [Candidatus Magasanikiibacteriota bacterium]